MEVIDERRNIEANEIVAGDDQQVFIAKPLAVDQLGDRADDAELFVLLSGFLDGQRRLLEAARGDVVPKVVGKPLVRADKHVRNAIVRL